MNDADKRYTYNMNHRSLTPKKESRLSCMSMQSIDSSRSSGGGFGSSSGGACGDDMMDDTSSVLSSPPRSGRRTASLKDDGNLSFSLPRLSRTTGPPTFPNSATKQNRRLFDDEDNSDISISSIATGMSAGGTSQQSSTKYRSPRRQMLRPLDLNHDLQDATTSTMSGPGDERQQRAVQSTPLPPAVGRKRTSTDRRGGINNNYRNNNNSSSANNSMDASPLISPNSFLTIDGRFVQSRNPFSSPMVTEEDSQTRYVGVGGVGGFASSSPSSHLGRTGQVPPMPMSFRDGLNSSSGNTTNSNGTGDSSSTGNGAGGLFPGFLPPRQQRQSFAPPGAMVPGTSPCLNPAVAACTSSLSSGYPDRRFIFTGSPIREDDGDTSWSNDGGGGGGGAGGYNAAAMSLGEMTETASGGSLHKVRRFNRSDDVVAASGLHMSSRRKDLVVETNELMSSSSSSNISFGDEISPTEVMNFPPPTPKKSKANRPLYASIRLNGDGPPTTPIAERRRNRTIGARTPHPGSFLNNNNRKLGALHLHSDDDDDSERHSGGGGGGCCRGGGGGGGEGSECSNKQCKSRFYSDFDIIGELGKGSFGTVYKVLSRLDGCMYAIKTAQRKAKGMADRDRMLKEVYALAALSDQADPATLHIVRYHQAWMEDDRLYIQTELCTGTLSDDIAMGAMTAEPRRFKFLREMLLALNFFHRQDMVHLDIKPDNIFLKNDQFKLGDFGLVSRANLDQDVDEGDSRYLSLELMQGDRSDLTKSDIFSLGATLYEICLDRPLPMNGQEWQDIRAGRLQPLPNTSPELQQIIHQMMNPNPKMRPTAGQLLTHPELLSDDQKALNRERNKVMQANLKLQAQAQQFSMFGAAPPPSQQQHHHRHHAHHHGHLHPAPPPPKRLLTRANTWSGGSLSLPAYL